MMFIEVGEKLHVMYRSLYENSTRRHFLGEVISVQGSVCRLEGFVFIYDDKTTEFIKKKEMRTTIINVAESGIIANVIDPNIVLEEITYKYVSGVGLIATDGREFTLDINEFGSKS